MLHLTLNYGCSSYAFKFLVLIFFFLEAAEKFSAAPSSSDSLAEADFYPEFFFEIARSLSKLEVLKFVLEGSIVF